MNHIKDKRLLRKGMKIKINNMPKFWNSSGKGFCPLDGNLKYPAVGTITDISFSYSHNFVNVRIKDKVYGFDPDSLIEYGNVISIKNINNE